MIIGYARVSTEEQNLNLQIDALHQAKCERIYEEKCSGGSIDRPELQRVLEILREGDTLVVWRLDRLGRSLKDLIELINSFDQRKINFKSIDNNIDTTTPMGKFLFHMNGAYAELERSIIRERTHAGLTAARVRGRFGGRPKALLTERKAMLLAVYKDQTQSVNSICKMFGISRTTLYKYLRSSHS